MSILIDTNTRVLCQGISNVGEAIGYTGGVLAQGVGEAGAGLGAGLFKGVWGGLGTTGKVAALGVGAYFIYKFAKGMEK